ncbi:MAG: RDD family protein [Acetobacteraceae bacterium]|nr:RDD family protein [Acetobacteraceae bacterium]
MQTARFGTRAAALLLDALWIVPLILLLRAVSLLSGHWPPSGLADLLVELIVALAVLTFWAENGATPGKRAMGVMIVDAATGGRPPVGRLVLRYVGYLLSGLPLLLGFLWVLWDPRRQGWHDKLAGTLVVLRPSTGGGR